MRSERSVKNSLYAITGQIISLVFGFITRLVFADVLGDEYLGVNNIFYSVLSLLSLTELGMGTAFTFALYKPIAEDDRDSISRIMNLYSLAYRIVAASVTVLGLLLIPFLPLITAEAAEVSHITVIYLIFLANSSASYLFSYKRALITAAEKDYKNSVNISLFSVIQNGAQLVLLLTTGSYILYLAAQLACTVLSNLAISHTAGRMFPYLGKTKGLPEEKQLGEIKKNVKAMFMNRFGTVAVTGTDNLLIATVGVALVGVYSNYLLLVQTVQTVLTQVINAVTASVGNLIAEGSERKGEIYRNIIFAVAWLYGFSAIALDMLMSRFIGIAFGADWVLSDMPVAVHFIAINFLLAGIRQPNAMYINAAGLFRPVRWRGFVEAGVNLVTSALFLHLGMGLFGVLLGTTVSHLAVGIIWETAVVGRHCVDGGAKTYILDNLAALSVVAVAWVITGTVCSFIPDTLYGFVAAVAVTAVLPNLLLSAVFFRTTQFRFFADIVRRMLGGLRKHSKTTV